jgi:hypothetical protein
MRSPMARMGCASSVLTTIRTDYGAGNYQRKLHTKAGEVHLRDLRRV